MSRPLTLRRPNGARLATLQPPVWRYTSFDDYVYHCYGQWNRVARGGYPCLPCGGDGWIYDPEDPGDPYEGNKLRRRLTCPTCRGSRVGPREPVYRVYLTSRQRHRRALQAFRAKVEQFIRVARTLSDDDLRVIKEVYLANDLPYDGATWHRVRVVR